MIRAPFDVVYAYVNNDPLNQVDPSGLLAGQVAQGGYDLLKGTARATVDLVTTPGHYFGTTLPNATGQLLDACGAVCDPGALASIGPGALVPGTWSPAFVCWRVLGKPQRQQRLQLERLALQVS